MSSSKLTTQVFSLVQLLIKHNLTLLSSYESLTGSLFASTLTAILGAGQVFKGTIVAYTNQAKINLA